MEYYKKLYTIYAGINSESGGRIQIIETLPGQSLVKSPHLHLL